MTAAAAKVPTPVLRNAAGEPPLGVGGLAFRDDQGEMFYHDRERAPSVRVGVLELESGSWLAQPPSFAADAMTFNSRDAALIFACDAMVEKARRFMAAKEGEGTHWTEGYGGRVIEWALSVKPEHSPVQVAAADAEAESDHPVSEQAAVSSDVLANIDQQISDAGAHLREGDKAVKGSAPWPAVMQPQNIREDRPARPDPLSHSDDRVIAGNASATSGSLNPEELTIAGYEASDAGAGLSDPVVNYLVEQYSLRKQFPAKHIFSMTTDVADGRVVSIATCACKQVFKFGSNDYLRMNAAIEAHWRRFGHEKTVDGMGHPIGEAAPTEAKKPKRKTKSKPGAGGLPAPIASATPVRHMPAGADAVHQEAVAPIGAASTEVSEPLNEGVDAPGTDIEPAREAGLRGGSLALSMAAEPDTDWSPMLSAALDLAWREPPKVSDVQAALLDFGKVYALPRKVERPILRWHGGKWKLAPWIISHFPPHKVYIEPFGGAGSVLLQKLPAITEVWNDLEGEVVNLFSVLRNNAADLALLIYLTPFSRQEYHSLYGDCDDPVERARQFVARSFMGQSSKGALRKSGFDSRINPDGFASRLNSLRAMPEEFYAIAERFRNVIIEQKPAEAVFAQYDREGVLFYVDPPYLSDRANHYTHELDEAGHVALLETLRSLAGMAVVSGYRSELYDAALTDWRRVEIDAHADGGIDRTEVVWLNPACAAALDEKHPTLFNIAALDAANTPPLGRDGD